MTSLAHPAYPAQDRARVARIESTPSTAQPVRKGLDSSKGLAAMLLAAVVAALLVVANQMVDNWSDGNLLAAWVILWAVGFAALGLCAGTARKLAVRAVAGLDAWSQRVARARADARFMEAAQNDPRIMAELQAALSRQEAEVGLPTQATQAPQAGWLSQYKHVMDWRESGQVVPARSGSWLAQYEPAFNMLRGAPND